MTSKPFDPDLYAEHDPAKLLAITYFERLGYQAEVNENQYGIDLKITTPRGKVFWVEIEVKTGWVGKRFPYRDLQLPQRKQKFANPDCYFMVINKAHTHFMAVPATNIDPSLTRQIDTRLTTAETFITVPLKNTQIFSFL
jgi:hypothetical protein